MSREEETGGAAEGRARTLPSPDERDTANTADRVRRGIGSWWFAWTLSHGEGTDRRLYGERKRDLLGGLGGAVVEIGPGAGVNLPYYRADVQWTGIEPNVHFHAQLRKKADRLDLDATVLGGVAEHLPVRDASADAVVSTLVLCSVDDLDATLSEIRRVLKPGGQFVFIEHVAAPDNTVLRRIQRWVRPVWGVIADGCRPNRETARVIRAAGFADVQIERFDAAIPLPVVRPHIIGWATNAM